MYKYYIDPVSGNDLNDGLSTGSAFKTIVKARNTVRLINSSMNGDVFVNLMDGRYEISSAIELGEIDSGNNGFDIVYQSYGAARPVISGGARLGNWKLHDKKKNIYKTKTASGNDSRQLYVNGKRAVRARSTDGNGWTKKEDSTGFYCPPEIASWNNLNDIEVVSRAEWKEYRGRIKKAEDGFAELTEPFWSNAQLHLPYWKMEKVAWMENAYELLNSEGQWYLDRKTEEIFYKPYPGEDMKTAEIIIPALEVLMQLKNVHNVQFKGITFSHATWLRPNSNSGFCEVQSGTTIRDRIYKDLGESSPFWSQMDGNVEVDYSRNIIFENNTFTHLGAYGLKFGRGIESCTIFNNVFTDISGGGISLGAVFDYHPAEIDKVHDNIIDNNYLTETGAEYHATSAILTGVAKNIQITHNEIYNVPYTGISSGWGWTDKELYRTDNIIKYNKVIKFMQVMFDGAAIYDLSYSPGTVISYNYVSDATPGTPGIYLDNGSCYKTVDSNVIEKMEYSFSAQNEPVHGNVFINNYYEDYIKIAASKKNTFENNTSVSNGKWPDEAVRIMNESGRNGILTVLNE